MPLISRLLQGDRALEACLVDDHAHLVQGTRGAHVPKVQRALGVLDGAHIDVAEVSGEIYGRTTAAAVLDYKQKRTIINFSYQTQADNIVGKMTIATLDREMAASENRPPLRGCLNERLQGGLTVTNSVSRQAFAVGDAPIRSLVSLRVVFQLAITKRFDVNQGRSLLQLIRRANLLLAPHGMRLDPRRALQAFPYPFPVTPAVASDAEGLRKAADKADKGSADVLRAIFCEFDGSENLTTTAYSAGRATGVDGFPNFVIVNPEITHPDKGTLLHEMIHCSNDRFMNNRHDIDKNSVLSTGDNRTLLIQEHADSIRGAFFGLG